MRVWLGLCLGVFAAGCLLLAGESRPDFSGVWKLNLEKSDFGNSAAPSSLISRIEHREPEIKVHSEVAGPQGEYLTDYKWITGGRENVNAIRGNEIHARAVWEGPVLVVTSTFEANGAKLTLLDRWSLAPAHRTLTVSRTISGPAGEGKQTYVYDKTGTQ